MIRLLRSANVFYTCSASLIKVINNGALVCFFFFFFFFFFCFFFFFFCFCLHLCSSCVDAVGLISCI